MNRDRRKIVAAIFADVAKYSLTAGVVGAIISGQIFLPSLLALGLIAGIVGVLAYFVTPVDKNDKDKEKIT
jgi:hypothetical protein